MVCQDVIAFLHHMEERLRRNIRTDFLSQHIMRRGKLHNCSPAPNQAVAIAGSRIKLKIILLQFPSHRFQQNTTILSTDLICTVVNNGFLPKRNLIPGNGHKITPQGYIGILHRYTDTQRLQGRTAGIIYLWVITQHGKVRRIGTRFHSLRNRMYQPNLGKPA